MIKNCKQCNREFKLQRIEQLFCGRKCSGISRIGFKHTDKAKEQNRLKHLGKIVWNKGRSSPETSGEKNSFFGKKHSEETRAIMKLKRANQITTEATKQKMSNSHKGINTWAKGKKKSLEERIKRSESQPKGKNHHWWKGGITAQSAKDRTSFELKYWKKACMERDNFTCQKTGIRGGVLNVHHINNFADFPELRTSIENGITLSEKSHKEFHKIYGNKNNTREKLIEFLNK